MKKLLLSVIMLSSLLVACQKAPENVQEKVDILDGNISKVDTNNSDSTYTGEVKEKGTLEEIRNQLEYDLQNNNTRISVNTARIGTGTTMPTYNVKIKSNDLKSEATQSAFENLAKLLFADKYINDEKAYEFRNRSDARDPNDSPHEEFWLNDDGVLMRPTVYNMDVKVYSPVKEKNTEALVAHSTGRVYGSPEGLEKFKISPTNIVIQVGIDDLDVSYPMEDGTMWKVSDAVKFAEEFFNNEDLMALEPQKGIYEVQYVYVMPMSDNTYAYFFYLNRKDQNGNYLDTHDSHEVLYAEDEIKNNKPFYMGTQAFIWCVEANKVYYFDKGYSFEYLDATDSGDELFTLNGALSILEKKLAKERALSIRCAELNYAIICKGYPYYEKNKEYVDDSYPIQMYYDASLCRSNCDFELRPVWVFKTEDFVPMTSNASEIYYVDAITGEVTKLG